MKDATRKKLMSQISDSAGNVLYTYSAHWAIVNRLKSRLTGIKITQIVLTAFSCLNICWNPLAKLGRWFDIGNCAWSESLFA